MAWLFSGPKVDHDRVVGAIRAAGGGPTAELPRRQARHKARGPRAAARAYLKKDREAL
jgi:hypothetical protein